LYRSGELQQAADKVEQAMTDCGLCPHLCRVNRLEGETGVCRSGSLPIVSSYSPHFGEEPPLVGRRGSGTIFFTNCNLSCVYCQNYDISHLGHGTELSYRNLADMMLELQDRGCHNINFVSPSHMVHAVMQSLLMAVERGLRVPLVYNTGGYDLVSTLELLNGVFDIYMPDFKYADEQTGRKLSGVEEYPATAKAALTEMHTQVGDLSNDDKGSARRGLLVRHLVLPGWAGGTREVIDFLAGLSKNTYLNLMDQYRPMYRACEYGDMDQRVTRDEMNQALEWARQAGLKRFMH
jgi:putative pyruvate formate lyase activating enzyme